LQTTLLSSADCCLFLFCLPYFPPTIRWSLQTINSFVDCCVSGQLRPWFASSKPRAQNIIVVSLPPPSHPTQLIVCSPNKPRPLDYLTNQFEPVRGQLFYIASPSRAHLVPKSSSTMKSPHLCASAGAISLAPRQN
jgi:hypothetical protein